MTGTIQAGLVLGGLWAFVDAAFTYVTGASPALDLVEIFGVPLAGSLLFHATCAASHRVRPHRAFEWIGILGVTLAPVSYLLRGREPFTPEALAAGILPIAAAGVVALRSIRRGEAHFQWTRVRLVLVPLLYFLAALAFALRADRVQAITTSMVLEIFGYVAALGVGLAVAATMIRGATAPLLFTFVLVASIGVAVRRGSGPPVFELPKTPAPAPPRTSTGSPNVLLIVLDTVRARNLDIYGYSKPTLAKTGAYLRDGLIFDAATASGTYSLTSHGSLFTGLLPSAHGAHTIIGGEAPYGRAWPDIETMAGWLKGKGYATHGVSANDIFLVPWTGLQKGFDTFLASSPRGLRFVPFASALRRSLARMRLLGRRTSGLTWTATEVTNAALAAVSASPEPFFLFLNYFDAHDPHVVVGTPPWPVPSPGKPIDAYDTEIAYIDGEIARLLAFLDEKGRLDQTLVILTADHGEYFGERNLRGHPAAPYELSLHVPLALRLPGSIAPGRSARRTGLLEVFRMVRGVLQGEPLDWMREADPSPRILSEAWAQRDYGRARPPDNRPSTTVVFAGNLKLIHRLAGRSELFDLDADPDEKRNLIDATDPALVALKEKMIREVMLRATRGPGPAPPLTEDAAERMRALGYLR